MVQAGCLVTLCVGIALLDACMHLAMPPLAWLALILVLHATRSLPTVEGALYLWLAASVTLAIGERATIPAPVPAYFLVVVMAAATIALPFAIDRVCVTRFGTRGFGPALVFPIAFVTTEFLRSRLTSAATWISIAYTQYGALPLMQVAAFVGIWGITFLISWFASTFEPAWSGTEWSAIRRPLFAFAAVFGTVVMLGAARVAVAGTDRPSMRVATLNRPIDLFVPGEITRITEGRVTPDDKPAVDAKLAKLQEWFLDGSRREARAGARLIVFPEQSLLVFREDEASFVGRAQRLAAEERVYLAMGMATIHLGDRLPLENKVLLVDPSGRILLSSLKTHAVPGWEAGIMKHGDGRLGVVATPNARIAAAICYDADFPEFIRQAGRASADLLILPANDWQAIKHVHFQMHAFRAIENGVPVVRAASSGLSGAVDAWGRVLAVSDFFAPGDRTMTAQVPVGGVATLYAKTGDLFAWLCVAVLVAALVIAAAGPAYRTALVSHAGRAAIGGLPQEQVR